MNGSSKLETGVVQMKSVERERFIIMLQERIGFVFKGKE